MGWNALRDQIFANQKRLGVIPANTQLTPWPDDLPKWDSLDADSKKLFARQAEVFAGYVAYADHEIGRVIQAVDDMGKLDNTLIIYIEGDNDTNAEGSTIGTPDVMTSYQGIPVPVPDQLKFYESGAHRRHIRTCRWRGHGLSIRRSSGPRHRISGARDKAWQLPGRPASKMPVASAPSSTT
jgi:arylsulfatase A-like enzyme